MWSLNLACFLFLLLLVLILAVGYITVFALLFYKNIKTMQKNREKIKKIKGEIDVKNKF